MRSASARSASASMRTTFSPIRFTRFDTGRKDVSTRRNPRSSLQAAKSDPRSLPAPLASDQARRGSWPESPGPTGPPASCPVPFLDAARAEATASAFSPSNGRRVHTSRAAEKVSAAPGHRLSTSSPRPTTSPATGGNPSPPTVPAPADRTGHSPPVPDPLLRDVP